MYIHIFLWVLWPLLPVSLFRWRNLSSAWQTFCLVPSCPAPRSVRSRVSHPPRWPPGLTESSFDLRSKRCCPICLLMTPCPSRWPGFLALVLYSELAGAPKEGSAAHYPPQESSISRPHGSSPGFPGSPGAPAGPRPAECGAHAALLVFLRECTGLPLTHLPGRRVRVSSFIPWR